MLFSQKEHRCRNFGPVQPRISSQLCLILNESLHQLFISFLLSSFPLAPDSISFPTQILFTNQLERPYRKSKHSFSAHATHQQDAFLPQSCSSLSQISRPTYRWLSRVRNTHIRISLFFKSTGPGSLDDKISNLLPCSTRESRQRLGKLAA